MSADPALDLLRAELDGLLYKYFPNAGADRLALAFDAVVWVMLTGVAAVTAQPATAALNGAGTASPADGTVELVDAAGAGPAADVVRLLVTFGENRRVPDAVEVAWEARAGWPDATVLSGVIAAIGRLTRPGP